MGWTETLNGLMLNEDMNIDDMTQYADATKGKDIGLIHPQTGAGLLARGNGNLEGYAGTGLGFRFDKSNNSLSFFAPHIQFFCIDSKTYDNENQPVLNPINPEFQDILDLLGSAPDE